MTDAATSERTSLLPAAWIFFTLLIVLALAPLRLLSQTAPGSATSPSTVPLRIASFNTELSRKGPGLLLRDIERGEDAQIEAVIALIAEIKPDILALQSIDWDYENRALKALERRLSLAGHAFPHLFARQPNSGLATALDLDGDQRLGGPGDSQGFGNYTGRSGIAVLSRLPIQHQSVTDLSSLLWRDLPGATLPRHPDGSPFPSVEAQAIQRLSATAHWALPVSLPDGRELVLLTFQATPPLFDGPEQRNLLRNRDEIHLWQRFLDQALPAPFDTPPTRRFVLAGGANLDPDTGAGDHQAIINLLNHPKLQDPRPQSAQAGLNTVHWPKAGQMRVDYLLPSQDLIVLDAGVLWPETPGSPAAKASRHRLIWVDLLVE
ncbi:3-phytase (myo-inositol-hexaphosphate 3-phosphohydrolase) [Phaeobacter sp. CECT 5382]|nr:3-phytase (myo-inositol-hexaphosphate 3-phosphohydrolase) [Phaeobacter sp. CECT 5382]